MSMRQSWLEQLRGCAWIIGGLLILAAPILAALNGVEVTRPEVAALWALGIGVLLGGVGSLVRRRVIAGRLFLSMGFCLVLAGPLILAAGGDTWTAAIGCLAGGVYVAVGVMAIRLAGTEVTEREQPSEGAVTRRHPSDI